MKISVAMCTYNGERYLQEQLRSIAQQTALPAEMVVCDDGSTDCTMELLRTFRDSVPFPVRLVENAANLGSTQNFAQCISLCTGEAIALCDQDDRWMPEKLAVCGAALEADAGLAAVFSDGDLMDDDGDALPETLWDRVHFDAAAQRSFAADPARYLAQQVLVTGAALVVRARERTRFLPMPSEWVHDAWMAFVLVTMSRLQPLPQHLFTYRLHRRQQVGLADVPWQNHLHTAAEDALQAHRSCAARYWQLEMHLTRLAERGEAVSPEALRRVRHRYRHEQTRTDLLEKPRLQRLVPALGSLPGYLEYDRGVMSLLRDLAHAAPA